MDRKHPQNTDFIDQLRDAFFALDEHWRFVYVNKAAETLLQRSKAQLLGTDLWVQFPAALQLVFFKEYHRVMREKVIVQFEAYYPPPLDAWFDVTASPYLEGIAVHFRDITAARWKLQESQEHYRSLFEHHPDAVFSLDPEGMYLSTNQRFTDILDYRSEELRRLRFDRLIAPEDLERTEASFAKAVRGAAQQYEIEAIAKDGRRVPMHVTNVPMIMDGKILGVYGIAKDISERRRAEEALLRSEAELKAALGKLLWTEELHRLISEHSQDVISISSPDGTIQYVSLGIRSLTGFEPDDYIGKKRTDFYHEEDRKNIRVPEGQDTFVSANRIRHKDGRYVWIETSTKVVRNATGEIVTVLGIGRDISERKAAEEMMIKSEKLTLTGQLAAGIAHEIRNPLTAIKGFFQLMGNGYSLQEEHVRVMSAELARIEGITNELLLLAKPNALHFVSRDVNDIVRQVVTLMETEANLKNTELALELHDGGLRVDCDENQLKQVFINFIKNGIESMPGGGMLRVVTTVDGGEATLRFVDRGIGIPADVLERIGQPFFTTKERGTGLGLAVSFNIVESHRGKIQIQSEVGSGTCFLVKLPLTTASR
ncbi:PAS domain S-box protein [Paenibacillus sp. TRM 82003]|nr:PAS domain S-box protein [Paenibacillus sp. TRM 82003]